MMAINASGMNGTVLKGEFFERGTYIVVSSFGFLKISILERNLSSLYVLLSHLNIKVLLPFIIQALYSIQQKVDSASDSKNLILNHL